MAHHIQIGMVLLFDGRVGGYGGGIVALFEFQVAQDDVGPAAFSVGE